MYGDVTWGPGGRLNHAGVVCRSDREHWGAEATSPTLPGCSAVEDVQMEGGIIYDTIYSTENTKTEKAGIFFAPELEFECLSHILQKSCCFLLQREAPHP